jgi:tRNA (guanine37-N1)-methyltransferase
MMRIDILSAVPELLRSPLEHSIIGRARERELVDLRVHDLHAYSENKHGKIDHEMYGGGAGMVMRIEPVARCIRELEKEVDYDERILMTADGEQLEQSTLKKFSIGGDLLILCGHYKGVDERIREQFITREISVGDYVLTGGELPAAVLIDGVVRLIPGVLNDADSALTDSHQEGLLSPPVYTRPQEFEGKKVPEILLSGDHRAIEEWRTQKALERTRFRRPDLLDDEEEGLS